MGEKSAEELHRALIDSLRSRGVLYNPRVEAAFRAIPRHLFLPGLELKDVYTDNAIAVKHDEDGMVVSSSSQPTMMALMLRQIDAKPGDNVLEIGTATGYNAAILQHVVGEEGRVTTVELDEDLAAQAYANLQENGFGGVTVIAGDGAEGYAPNGPYDSILVTAGIWDVPLAWREQLKPGGVIVAPIWIDGVQVSATLRVDADGALYSQTNSPCAFVYLRGVAAGPNYLKRVGSTALYIMADDVDQIDAVGLHMLLSDDFELCSLGLPMTPPDYWYGFQLYLMLNEPPGFIFAVFAVYGSQRVCGIEGRGIALFSPGSASFVSYEGKGEANCYAGSDSYLALLDKVHEWDDLNRPGIDQLRLRMVPRECGAPVVTRGRLYKRRSHYLHAWLEL